MSMRSIISTVMTTPHIFLVHQFSSLGRPEFEHGNLLNVRGFTVQDSEVDDLVKELEQEKAAKDAARRGRQSLS